MSDNSVSLTIGGETKVMGLGVAGRLFVFNPGQMNFLLNLQKMKNVAAAALSVGRTEEWGTNFLRSRKFKEYISCKMQEFSVRNGLTVEWWYQFGKWAADGVKEFYQAHCPGCGWDAEMNVYEVESQRQDDMNVAVECPACCFKPVSASKKTEEFKPSREQIGAWQELGARLIPKVERVHHQFENVDIKFESEEVQDA